MDEGRPFAVPPPHGWSFETETNRASQVAAYRQKLQSEASFDLNEPRSGADEVLTPAGEAIPYTVRSAYRRQGPGVDGDAAPEQPTGADIVAALIAARDAEIERARNRERDLKRLVSSNKALRRDMTALQVRTWRDEKTIARLESDLAQTRDTRAAAIRRGRQLAGQLETLGRRRFPFMTPGGGHARAANAPHDRRQLMVGDEPFFKRGFLLGDSAAIVGPAVERVRNAPSGIMIFGPYISLVPGTYVATVDARLYQRVPLWTDFEIEVACDRAEQIIASRRLRLLSSKRWRHFELSFTVWDGEDYADFELRIWARVGAPLAIRRVELYELAAPRVQPGGPADAQGGNGRS